MDLLPHEDKLMRCLLSGDDPILAALRAQYDQAIVVDREYTRSGFFTTFHVPQDLQAVVPAELHIGDVWFDRDDDDAGGEAILFVSSGRLAVLEGVARSGVWPEDALVGDIHYFGESRDLAALRESWGGV